ncbi:MAG: hypothetical protein A2Z83_09750 [Omnitrophica bacterium GWA2_52_8]|nr:MAG: hypothetical protein A2Z83_09750 [Omnitrophica bacterium GWA2_52_8]
MQNDLFETMPYAHAVSRRADLSLLERYQVTLRFDHVLVVFIGFLILNAVIFSLGVEKGKAFSQAQLHNERKKQQQMADDFADKTKQLRAMSAMAPSVSGVGAMVSGAAEDIAAVRDVQTLSANEAVAPASAAIPAITGGFTIQVVTYKSKKAADALIGKLGEKGHQGFVIPSGSFMQVCINQFQLKDEARSFLAKLKSEKIVPADAFVRAIPSVRS